MYCQRRMGDEAESPFVKGLTVMSKNSQVCDGQTLPGGSDPPPEFPMGMRKSWDIKRMLPEQAATMGVPAAVAGFLMLVVMTFFQLGKHLLFPGMTIWESHLFTNLFIVTGATGSACFVFRKQRVLYGQAMVEIAQRRQAEEALQRYQEKLYSMAMELSLAEERERRRIASELHDQVGQSLLLSRIKLGMLQSSLLPGEDAALLGDIRGLLDQSIQDIRSLTFQLTPPLLASAGLEAALEWLGRQLEKDYDLRVDFFDDGQLKPLTEEIRSALYQAVRELLINAAKHAQTKEVTLAIAREGATLKVTVKDHGVGFNLSPAGPKGPGNGFGLFNICQRIEYLGGELTVASQPGTGTIATIQAPLHNP